jgi:AcrR family transcriptional regulator
MSPVASRGEGGGDLMRAVAIEQRRRILAAVPVALAGGKGYESVTVERIIAMAGGFAPHLLWAVRGSC